MSTSIHAPRWVPALCAHATEPFMAVDAEHRVVMVTEPFARLLQQPAAELAGRPLAELFASPSNEALAAFVAGGEPPAGAVEGTCSVLASRELGAVGLRFERVGEDLADGYVGGVVYVATGSAYRQRDADYDVTIAQGAPGQLTDVAVLGRSAQAAELAGHRCFELMSTGSAPCPHCPLLPLDTLPPGSQRSVVREVDGAFVVHSAKRLSDQLAHVSIRRYPSSSWLPIQRARVATLAKKAGLSPREQSVLERLIEGATPDEIASALTISARTVRFHQANLLTKLGAHSRLELFRVLRDFEGEASS